MLTGGIRLVEREQAARGSNTPHFDAMLGNLSRLLATAVKWTIRHGQPAADLNRHWTGELSAAVDQALALVPWKRDASPKSRSAAPGWQGARNAHVPHM